MEDWEREVRKLFDIEEPKQAKADAPPPPPLVVKAPPVASRPQPQPVLIPSSSHAPRAYEEEGAHDPDEGPQVVRIPSLSPPGLPAWKPSGMEGVVAARLRKLDERTSKASLMSSVSTPAPADRLMPAQLWRSPQSLRDAFVSSLIFGPPKSLEVERGV